MKSRHEIAIEKLNAGSDRSSTGGAIAWPDMEVEGAPQGASFSAYNNYWILVRCTEGSTADRGW